MAMEDEKKKGILGYFKPLKEKNLNNETAENGKKKTKSRNISTESPPTPPSPIVEISSSDSEPENDSSKKKPSIKALPKKSITPRKTPPKPAVLKNFPLFSPKVSKPPTPQRSSSNASLNESLPDINGIDLVSSTSQVISSDSEGEVFTSQETAKTPKIKLIKKKSSESKRKKSQKKEPIAPINEDEENDPEKDEEQEIPKPYLPVSETKKKSKKRKASAAEAAKPARLESIQEDEAASTPRRRSSRIKKIEETKPPVEEPSPSPPSPPRKREKLDPKLAKSSAKATPKARRNSSTTSSKAQTPSSKKNSSAKLVENATPVKVNGLKKLMNTAKETPNKSSKSSSKSSSNGPVIEIDSDDERPQQPAKKVEPPITKEELDFYAKEDEKVKSWKKYCELKDGDFQLHLEKRIERAERNLIINDEDIEKILGKIQKANKSMNVAENWKRVSNQGISEESDLLQFTRLYQPVKLPDFIGGDSSDKNRVASWMYDWRCLADKRREQSQSSKAEAVAPQSNNGKQKKKTKKKASRRRSDSDSSDEEYVLEKENVPDSKTVFLFGMSGLGKAAFVHACAKEYNFKVIEVHPGQERSGSVLRETLSEATQSERLQQKKTAMQNFFKTSKVKVAVKTAEKSKDTLIYFSNVDLLFSEDEGFWRALKNFIDKTKVPIIFSGETIEANSGLNPEKSNIDAEEQQKCIEVALTSMQRKDLVTFLRLVALDKGFFLSQENASTLTNYCHSYRQCLLQLQLWSCAYPLANSSPLLDTCGVRKLDKEENEKDGKPQEIQDFGRIAFLDSKKDKLLSLYNGGVRFIAVNRWKLMNEGVKYRRISMDEDEFDDLVKMRQVTSVMSLLDRRTCSIQETWSSAKSDTTNSCCRAPRMDSNRHHSLQQEIQCYLETSALQNSTISERLWLPTIDKEFQFSKPLPKSKAMTASSVDEKILNYQNQLDGCCWKVPPFYSMGYRLFAQDYVPAIAHFYRQFKESGELNARGIRKRGGGQDYLESRGFACWDEDDKDFLSRPFPYFLKY